MDQVEPQEARGDERERDGREDARGAREALPERKERPRGDEPDPRAQRHGEEAVRLLAIDLRQDVPERRAAVHVEFRAAGLGRAGDTRGHDGHEEGDSEKDDRDEGARRPSRAPAGHASQVVTSRSGRHQRIASPRAVNDAACF